MTRIGSKPPVWIRPDTPPKTIPEETPPPISEKVPFGPTPLPLPTPGPKTVAGLLEVFDQGLEDIRATNAVKALQELGTNAEVVLATIEREHDNDGPIETVVLEIGDKRSKEDGYIVVLNYADKVAIREADMTYPDPLGLNPDGLHVRTDKSRVILYNALNTLVPTAGNERAVRIAKDILTSQTHGIDQNVLGLQDQNRAFVSGSVETNKTKGKTVTLVFYNDDPTPMKKTAVIPSKGSVVYKQDGREDQNLTQDATRLLAAQIEKFRESTELSQDLLSILDEAAALIKKRNLPPWELDPQESWHWHDKK